MVCWWVLVRIQLGGTQKTINFCDQLSFILSFLFRECLHCCCCILFAHHSGICTTTTVISLQPCGHGMLSFSIFILRFNKISDQYWLGFEGRTEAQREGEFSDNSIAWATNNWKPKQYTLWNAYWDYECMYKGLAMLTNHVILTNQGGKLWVNPNLPWSTDKGREERSLL
jgi:hypothetical protein